MKDKQIEKLIKNEEKRLKDTIDLIASENSPSEDVFEALGSVFNVKYSEGYPNARYYRGQENADKLETLCKERALKLFKLSPKKWAVNVQPLSGSPANVAVYFGVIPKGGKIMGMSLSAGGHLTHGHGVSITGTFWNQVPYGVDSKTEKLDYEEIEKIAVREKPDIIVAGFTAYPRTINWKKFRNIADKAGSLLMVDMSHIAGLVAGGAHPSPFPYADIVTSTTHKTLRGPRSAIIFSRIDERKLDKKIDKAVFPGMQGGPHLNQIAGVAVALGEALKPNFKTYANQIVKNAKTLADELKNKGWKIVSGGTDNHLLLVDVWMDGAGLSGEHASIALEKNGIVVNKNTIPNEKRSPRDPSGLRLGSAAETTKGAKEKDFKEIAEKIDLILKAEINKR